MEDSDLKSVLFVGKGDNCCSLLAEVILRDQIEKQNASENIKVDSAGTTSWQHANLLCEEAIAALSQYGIHCEHQSPRQLERKDVESFDYLVALDRETQADLELLMRSSSGKDHCFLLLELIHSYTLDVPNPYYTKDYDEAYHLINEGCKALLNKIK
ncbi:arsenate reductase/protein-tyrosine-phosphatase family protein [Jeotgalibacillus campisalis]|uniref:protein-tyrosine-phosphatase n=1 Tax=Jeotgalibacillus campisalis TaxID=220754 RepID=A0A0C2RZB8_9BACL|nr:hypothetical protein [Jeotgalibacillus campisalis]KIL47144.1 hypothetical protein KR50_24660 [Jeotgalibacillus campisalis]